MYHPITKIVLKKADRKSYFILSHTPVIRKVDIKSYVPSLTKTVLRKADIKSYFILSHRPIMGKVDIKSYVPSHHRDCHEESGHKN